MCREHEKACPTQGPRVQADRPGARDPGGGVERVRQAGLRIIDPSPCDSPFPKRSWQSLYNSRIRFAKIPPKRGHHKRLNNAAL